MFGKPLLNKPHISAISVTIFIMKRRVSAFLIDPAAFIHQLGLADFRVS